LEEKVKELNRLIEDEKKADEVTKKTLTQEQLVNKSLKEELEKVAKLKEKLEEDLKEALVSSGKKSSIQR
jgi:CHASE3 domain sensor protein